MSPGLAPTDVPVCESPADRDRRYRDAQRDGEPFLAVDAEEQGYPITYDLLPAGQRLSSDAHAELEARVREEIERVIDDPDAATDRLDAGIGPQMGNVYFFAEEATARDVAAAISRIVLDERNWVADPAP
jgi:hypothetical protein